jgi:hypothetical protein
MTGEDQALVAFRVAQRGGDENWARGMASTAFERGWTRVLDAYVAGRPEIGEALAELASFGDRGRQFEDSVAFATVTIPRVPDRGPAEVAAERQEAQAPFPTYSGRVVDLDS